MGRWRNKWENAPAPMDMKPFNKRLFDPVNALISHSDKLELQSLAKAAAGGDPKAVQAYQDRLWNSGLTQDEKLALGEMFMPKQGKNGKIKASPQDVPVEQPMQRADGILPGSDNWWDDPKYKDFIKQTQSGGGWDGVSTTLMNSAGYYDAQNRANKEGRSSFDYQMTPEELAALREKYQLEEDSAGGYGSWSDSAYVNPKKKKGKGGTIPTVANESNQSGPVAPKKSAKERMQEKYGIKPRMQGRGYTEY